MSKQVERYYIKRIISETHNILRWHIVRKDGGIFDYKPGQFSMIHLFNQDGTTWQKKAYSMSSSSLNREYLEFGIKIHGEFTQKMAALQVGVEVGIEGPYGFFTYDLNVHKNAAMFAGGIGITPFISMIRYATEQKLENNILLYYCNQTEKEISYKEVIDQLSRENSHFSICYSVDNPETSDWKGEFGFIDEEKIAKYVKDFSNTYFFMCGPIPFIKVVESILNVREVPRDRIKKEIF